VATEASPRTFWLLMRNLKLNGARNVRAVNVAVSDRAARLDLFEVSKGNIGTVTTLPTRGGKRVNAIDALPLERILTADEIRRLRLIKIDVEGAERQIMQSLIDKLTMYPPDMDIIVGVSPDEDYDAWKGIFRRLQSAGFAAFEIENFYDVAWYLGWKLPAPFKRVSDMPKRQEDLLFTRAHSSPDSSRGYERGSFPVRANLASKDRGNVFPNAACVTAPIDRLTHHAKILALTGES